MCPAAAQRPESPGRPSSPAPQARLLTEPEPGAPLALQSNPSSLGAGAASLLDGNR